MPGRSREAAERDVANLFRVPPPEFVAARDRLVRSLRKEGQDDLAAEVHALRRPTVAAWSINQVAHTRNDRVGALVAVGEELQRAQARAAAGENVDLRAAARRRRALLDELADAAMSAAVTLGAKAVAHRDAIEATLAAASLDSEMQSLLVEGRLTKELPRPAGFGLDDATAVRSVPAPKRRTSPPRDELAIRRAEAALTAARDDAAKADAVVAAASGALRDAEAEVDDAIRKVEALEVALGAAKAHVRDAKQRAVQARRDHDAAEALRRRAAAKRSKAEGEVTEAVKPS